MCCVELFDVKGTVYLKEVKSKRKAKKKIHKKQVLEPHYHCGLPVNGHSTPTRKSFCSQILIKLLVMKTILVKKMKQKIM